MFQVRLPQDTARKLSYVRFACVGFFLLAFKTRANQMTKAAISITIKSTSYHAK